MEEKKKGQAAPDEIIQFDPEAGPGDDIPAEAMEGDADNE